MRISRWTSTVLCAALGSAGCGDDADDSGGGGQTGTINHVSSSVPKGKSLSELSEAELQDVHKAYAAAVTSDEIGAAMCNFVGAFASGFGEQLGGAEQPEQPSCEQVVSECKMSFSTAANTAPMAGAGVSAPPSSTAAFTGCDVSVGDYEQCLTQTLQAFAKVFGGFTCGSDVTSVDMSALAPTQLSACTSLSSSCAGALGGG